MRRLNIAEMKINDGVNSQLSISRSDRQDSGLYKCVAENSFGKSEHLIYLAVQGKFNIYHQSESQSVLSVNYASSVNNLATAIHGRLRFVENGSSIISCIVCKKQWISIWKILFIHTESPDTPSNLEIVEVSSRSVKLSWRRPFDGNSPVLSYVVQYQPLSSLHAHSSPMKAANDWSVLTTINITLPTISGSRRYVYNRQILKINNYKNAGLISSKYI